MAQHSIRIQSPRKNDKTIRRPRRRDDAVSGWRQTGDLVLIPGTGTCHAGPAAPPPCQGTTVAHLRPQSEARGIRRTVSVDDGLHEGPEP